PRRADEPELAAGEIAADEGAVGPREATHSAAEAIEPRSAGRRAIGRLGIRELGIGGLESVARPGDGDRVGGDGVHDGFLLAATSTRRSPRSSVGDAPRAIVGRPPGTATNGGLAMPGRPDPARGTAAGH